MLSEFKANLQAHLLTENVRFYVYLTHHFAADSVNSQIITDFRREMDSIARVVMSFLRRYHELPLNDTTAVDFKRELDEIGAALVKRIKREEDSLYPLYQPAY